MKHARSDYDRIQDPEGLIPEDEPVFLIRAQDKNAPAAVRAWAAIARQNGAADNIVTMATLHAERMEWWQLDHGSKTPDAPEGIATTDHSDGEAETRAEGERERPHTRTTP
jgi:hypothetical protein